MIAGGFVSAALSLILLALGAGLVVYGGIGFLSVYGNRRSRFDIQVEEVVVRIPKLSRLLDGYTIVQVSDIHTGPFVQEHELRRGLAEIARLRPDLLVATGDLVDIDITKVVTICW